MPRIALGAAVRHPVIVREVVPCGQATPTACLSRTAGMHALERCGAPSQVQGRTSVLPALLLPGLLLQAVRGHPLHLGVCGAPAAGGLMLPSAPAAFPGQLSRPAEELWCVHVTAPVNELCGGQHLHPGR